MSEPGRGETSPLLGYSVPRLHNWADKPAQLGTVQGPD